VRTDYSGLPSKDGLFDEIVVTQEYQVVPAFLIRFTPGSLTDEGKKFQKGLQNENKMVVDEDEQSTDQSPDGFEMGKIN